MCRRCCHHNSARGEPPVRVSCWWCWQPVLATGEHDYGGAENLRPYLNYMPVQRHRWYEVRVGPVQLFMLDSHSKFTQ